MPVPRMLAFPQTKDTAFSIRTRGTEEAPYPFKDGPKPCMLLFTQIRKHITLVLAPYKSSLQRKSTFAPEK